MNLFYLKSFLSLGYVATSAQFNPGVKKPLVSVYRVVYVHFHSLFTNSRPNSLRRCSFYFRLSEKINYSRLPLVRLVGDLNETILPELPDYRVKRIQHDRQTYVGSAVLQYSAPIASNDNVIRESSSFIYYNIRFKCKAPA